MGILLWLGTLWGRVALGVGLVASLVALRAFDVSTQRAKGAEKAVATIKRATDDAIQKSAAAARRSADPAARGVRNPYYRD